MQKSNKESKEQVNTEIREALEAEAKEIEKQAEAETVTKCKECGTGKSKKRTEKEYKDIINRLSRIEGQVRGVKKMVENDAYCIDVLRQTSAICAALRSFNKVILSNHIKTCVVENLEAGNEEVVDELVDTMQKLMK